ncbi:hypothetical protein DFH06DRAFT_1406427 [Mycena polygramma]|nr:hypothetical protein DFH06DRAFT_1406427 [Mycena polygramma]
MGMLQIDGFTPFTRFQVAALTPSRRRVWQQAKDSLKEGQAAGHSLGLIEATNGDGQAIGISAVPACPITGEVTEQPFNIESCMEFLNNYIRADTNNEMQLRTEMLPSDINTIREARAGSNSLAATALRDKMARDKIFKPLIQWMELHPHTRQA